MTYDPQSEAVRALVEATIKRAGNGWIVEATIIRDAGDGIPWPYKTESVYESADKMLADLADVIAKEQR